MVLTRWAGGDESGKRSAVLVAHPDGARWSVGAPSFLDVDVADGSSGRAIPCDVDGDGFVDVVVATATKREPIGSAIILWNDGQGALDVEHRTVIPNPDPGEFGRLTSVACLRADRDADGELALLLSNGVFLAKLDRASRKVVSTEQLVEPSGDALEGGIDCVARDIDGDGLDDLAVADAAGIHVYRARPEVQ